MIAQKQHKGFMILIRADQKSQSLIFTGKILCILASLYSNSHTTLLLSVASCFDPPIDAHDLAHCDRERLSIKANSSTLQ
jgi:hypothetical protein